MKKQFREIRKKIEYLDRSIPGSSPGVLNTFLDQVSVGNIFKEISDKKCLARADKKRNRKGPARL